MTQTPDKILVDFRELPTYGVMLAQVPNDIMLALNVEIKRMMENNFDSEFDYRQLLLGHVSHEFGLDSCIPILEPFLLYAASLYNEKWNYFQALDEQFNVSTPKQLRLTDLWVNFQKKHEFNPPHTHTGIMSFVIWVSIPYDLKEEEKVFPEIKSGPTRTSKFTFHYVNVLGQMQHYTLNVDKEFEGNIALFPSHLNHSVNPFYTSDEYRISVAGNLRLST
jgi:hypothetical protein